MSAATLLQNQLDEHLAVERAAGRLALVPYLTAGYPDRDATRRWGSILAANGATAVELGVPFSDPIGDGPTIQRSSQCALDGGMSLRGSIELARSVSTETGVPVVLMSYCNLLFRMGLETFAAEAHMAGITGVIVPDLPVEESQELARALQSAGIHLIYLLSPASTDERIRQTAAVATGFIYCMALTGVTGARQQLAADLPAFLARVRALTMVPLIVGFGISRSEHIKALSGLADGAIVASALIDLVDRTPVERQDDALATYIQELHNACSGS